MATRIPITMCHGTSDQGEFPLPRLHLTTLVGIAAELGFTSIDYDGLAAWRDGSGDLPEHPIMFDFDHPVTTMLEVREVLGEAGFAGNLFVNSGPMAPENVSPDTLTWAQISELVESGWHIGAHTVTHPNLSALVAEDPQGEKLQWELETCDQEIEKELGIKPRDFAFTGTSWSSVAEKKVMERYRFGRLWIVGSEYQADGDKIRYAELVGVEGEDEADGGPPMAARYITANTPPYRLPSMEFQAPLIHEASAFRAYLEGALD
ncbi:MAG: polysaccharide deacetylase family protein [Gemmatimonadetes bacterium]|jgi:peptidoglycan/xylan/chitin deacetylase (PgdA/CDA1 family)|nr:polysaccharide deacetylase family protein [Gemmatimonadota bacterium]MBT4610675.1 polysaccharide deacetylase family protein [Gemmatimonadota bacterium]MBT5057647.1 polysaccharide deacetylase family protein [Gemmatimonadota bacterium]MBT5146155.1 polysaccharide deacetylase family protein [Gemmatimonadota bacterium]MBT5587595.1 polysaccharide deacetylase family protein [Gemmatimonadota bacterium]